MLSFFSISSDGRVTNWTLMKNKLEAEEVIKLKLVIDHEKELVENKKEAFLYGLAGGMCFDFNKFNDNYFLVGTEEGKIHLCSKAYSGQYLETYEVRILRFNFADRVTIQLYMLLSGIPSIPECFCLAVLTGPLKCGIRRSIGQS